MDDRWRTIRDIALFVVGLAGIAYETVVVRKDIDPTLLALFAGMVGLPAFFRADEKRRNGGKGRGKR